MSYTEFSYMLLQAYDFVHLHQRVRLRTASRRQRPVGQHHRGHRPGPTHAKECNFTAVTWPLLTKSDGTKMGKTESGAIWLSAERTSPYQFYQYWINVDDADAGGCLRMLDRADRTKKSNRSMTQSREHRSRQAGKPEAPGRRTNSSGPR